MVSDDCLGIPGGFRGALVVVGSLCSARRSGDEGGHPPFRGLILFGKIDETVVEPSL